MPRIFPIIKRVIASGDVPAGSAIMSDSFKLGIQMAEAIAAGNDVAAFHIAAAYADAIDAETELLKVGVSGYQDDNPTPGEALASTATTWGGSTTTAGTAPTNPANAVGQNNGTLANVKVGGIPGGAASTLNVIVARASILPTGSKSIAVYYRTNRELTGLLDTFTLTFTNGTGGTPLTIALPDGDFLTTPFEQGITDIGSTGNPTFTFTHTALIAATSGSVDIDAVAIRSTGAL